MDLLKLSNSFLKCFFLVKEMDNKSPLRNLLGANEHPPSWFNEIARELLLRSQLLIAGKKYEICEIEFYLHNEQHPDPYVHKAEVQLTTAQWYFHREKSAKKGFTLKGIDLTFGCSSDSKVRYGGILIRAICPVDTKDIVEGPSKTLDRILDENKVESVLALKELSDYKGDALSNPLLSIIPCTNLQLVERTLALGPRIGLKKKDSNSEVYQQALYRYTSRRTELKKGKSQLRDMKPRLVIATPA